MSAKQEKPDRVRAGLPRWVDLGLGTVFLASALPVILVVAVTILVDTGRPVIYRQKRIGRSGRAFYLYKFRTMHGARRGPAITTSADRRITRTGRWIRRYKLDELPELFNVLKGDMALVGPRPEVPRFVGPDNPCWAAVLMVRPGMTDPVSLALWDESALLTSDPDRVEEHYANELLPRKLDAQRDYLLNRSWRTDLAVIGRTIFSFILPLFSRTNGKKPYAITPAEAGDDGVDQ